nr:LamG-like jellyroll fold domain-containing protein [uncultured Desulfobacter sp.]
MTIQPQYHWQFKENEGPLAKDSVDGVEGKFQNVSRQGHGRIGNAIRINGNNSHINLGKIVGQFGRGDFTIAFGINILDTHGENDMDIIGNRTSKGHGNFFAVRLIRKAHVCFEVDQDNKGTHHVPVDTERLPITDKKWHHAAVVREGRKLRVYFNGQLAAENTSDTGIADINNGNDLKLGDWKRGTPVAKYEDLRIYHKALNATQIQNLIPPFNRLLNTGEIELVAMDDAAVILTQDIDDLSSLSSRFQKLRLGKDTGVTLFQKADYQGVFQKLYADIPDTRFTRLNAFPQSIHIWPTIGDLFTGKWIIAASGGRYLSRDQFSLTTASHHLSNELFRFHYNVIFDMPQIIPATDQDISSLKIDNEPAVLLVDDSESRKDAFSIVNHSKDRWVLLNQNNTTSWTSQHENRTLFYRVGKIADNEGQVGQLSQGEVALYEHIAYRGRTWVLCDSKHDVAGDYKSLKHFPGLDNLVSSIRLGPDTGVTLFDRENQEIIEAKRETDVQDVVENIPDLRESQIGNDTISSIKIFRTVSPDTLFTSFSSTLSQDYRMVGGKLEEFSAYRTILKFTPGAGDIEVSATDLTTIEVEGASYEIDEVRAATLTPNAMGRIMITSEADGLNTPGLKFYTRDMAENERVIIFPDQEAHRQIAELEADALWNATDTQGKSIIDKNKFTRTEIASVQNTVTRAMSAAVPDAESPADDTGGNGRVGVSALKRTVSVKQTVSPPGGNAPWTLNFGRSGNSGNKGKRSDSSSSVMSTDRIWDKKINQNDFEKMLAKAISVAGPGSTANAVSTIGVVAGARSVRGFFSDVKDAVKKATSVTIGFAKDVMNVIVDVGGSIVSFVLDTARKIVDFVEAVIEKVVDGIKKFIEFLQFLFDWDDIVKTQRHLKSVINSLFDSAARIVDSAKQPVSDFADSLQETVEDGFDTLKRTLGIDPSKDRTSDFELPEAAEWFLAKLLGNSRKSGAAVVSDAVLSFSDDSAMAKFRSTLERREEIAGMVLQGFEGLTGTIETLVANPRRPQLALIDIIETLKDAVIASIDFLEDIALGLLEAVVEAIDHFKKLINGEIDIPFISDLLRLIGIGKLAPLNLATLILAIPVTVISKIAYNERPFKDGAVPDFSPRTQTEPVTKKVRRSQVEQQDDSTPNTSESDAAESGASLNTLRSWGITALAADATGGILTAFLDGVPEKADTPFEKTAGFGMEFTTLVLDIFSFQAGIIVSNEADDGREKSDAEQEEERWGKIVNGYRGAVLALDSTVLLLEPEIKQRMKRKDEYFVAFYTLLASIDVVLTSISLSKSTSDNKPVQISYEVFSLLPDLLGVMRFGGPKASLGLAVIDIVSMGIATGLGGKLLADDVAELKKVL